MIVGKQILTLIASALVIIVVLSACGDGSSSTDVEYVGRAKNHLEKGETAAAIIELKNALKKNADNGEARWLLGKTYVGLGNGVAAQKELRKALELGIDKNIILPLDAEALLLQGRVLDVLMLEMPQASKLEAVVEMHVARGESFLKLNKIEDASREFRAALELKPDAVSAMVGMAKVLMSGGYREARTWLDKALELDPKYGAAWSLLGDLARFQGKGEEADKAYSRAIELRQDDLEDRFKKTLILVHLKRYDEAASELALLKKRAPRSAGFSYAEGVFQYSQKRYEEARKAFENTLAINPKSMPTVLFLGSIYLVQGKYEQADTYLSRYVKARPRHAYGLKLLAVLRLRTKRFKDAEDLVRPLLAKSPDDPFALNVLAQALIAQGKGDEALAYLKKVSELSPDSANSTIRLGLGLLAQDETAEAMSVLESAVALDQQTEVAEILLVFSHMKQSKFTEAVAAAKAYSGRYPGSPMPHNLRGMAYLGLKSEAQARQAFRDALRVSPGDPSANYNLASLALRDKDYSKAKAHYEAVLAAHENHLETLLKLAALGARQGDDALERESLERAVASNPSALAPRTLLGRYHLRKGQPKKALQIMSNAQIEHPDNPAVLALVGEAQLGADDASSAEGTLLRLVEHAPKSPQAHFLLATAYDRLGKRNKVREQLDQVLELNPGHVQARIALVRLLIAEGKIEESNANVAVLKMKHGDHADVLSLEGSLALADNNPDRALMAYQKAFETAPSGGRLIELSRARWAAGNRVAAVEEMEKWARQHPNDVPVLIALGNAYLNLERQQDAISVYTKVFEDSPDNLIVLNNLAYLLRKKDPERALSYAERAREIAPESATIMDTYALVLLERGDAEKARRLIDGALLKVPDNPTMNYHKALILAISGKNRDARVLLERILSQKEMFAERGEAQALFDSL